MKCPCRQEAVIGEKGMETKQKERKLVYWEGNVSASVGSLKVGDIQAESGKRRRLTKKETTPFTVVSSSGISNRI
jgi:hypothetical protein